MRVWVLRDWVGEAFSRLAMCLLVKWSVALFWLLFVAWSWPMKAGAFMEFTGQGNEGRASVDG